MTRARRAALSALLLAGSIAGSQMLSAPPVEAEPTDCMGEARDDRRRRRRHAG